MPAPTPPVKRRGSGHGGSERFFPCGIEWLLAGGTLRSRSDPGLSIADPKQADLQTHAGEATSSASSSPSSPPASDQVWAAFGGRLGIAQTNAVESATRFDGSGLGCLQWAYVDVVGTGARWLDLLPPSVVEANGARGPAARPWVK